MAADAAAAGTAGYGATVNPYDDVPYPSHAFAATAPHRLAALGALFGMDTPDPASARVLELGSSSGGNLVAHAAAWPDSRCLGLDLSPRQVALGQGVARELGLANLTLEVADLLAWRPEPGAWDYVICHGVYSWVPAEVQAAILQTCRAALAPGGVAVVSWNANPGWHVQGVVRDAMRYLVDPAAPLAHRSARAQDVVRVLASGVGDTPHGRTLARLSAQLELLPDSYVAHEYLEAFNTPLYLAEFTRQAAAAGLRYLCDSHVAGGMMAMQPPDVSAWLGGVASRQVEAEQYLDFVHCRPFHTSLLVGGHEPLRRDLREVDLAGWWVARPAPGEGLPLALGAAMARVAEVWPRAVRFDEVAGDVEDRRGLIDATLAAFFAGELALTRHPRAGAVAAGERPEAWAAARAQAGRGHMVANLWHDTLALAPLDLLLLRRCDGQRTVAELAEGLAPVLARLDGLEGSAEEVVRGRLAELSARGLFVA